jgi:hypothetical protein
MARLLFANVLQLKLFFELSSGPSLLTKHANKPSARWPLVTMRLLVGRLISFMRLLTWSRGWRYDCRGSRRPHLDAIQYRRHVSRIRHINYCQFTSDFHLEVVDMYKSLMQTLTLNLNSINMNKGQTQQERLHGAFIKIIIGSRGLRFRGCHVL